MLWPEGRNTVVWKQRNNSYAVLYFPLGLYILSQSYLRGREKRGLGERVEEKKRGIRRRGRGGGGEERIERERGRYLFLSGAINLMHVCVCVSTKNNTMQ